MQATAKNTATARIQGTLTTTAGMTAAQKTTASSGDRRTDEIPVAERTSTTVGTPCIKTRDAGNSKEHSNS
jgi:hypothetical protein